MSLMPGPGESLVKAAARPLALKPGRLLRHFERVSGSSSAPVYLQATLGIPLCVLPVQAPGEKVRRLSTCVRDMSLRHPMQS